VAAPQVADGRRLVCALAAVIDITWPLSMWVIVLPRTMISICCHSPARPWCGLIATLASPGSGSIADPLGKRPCAGCSRRLRYWMPPLAPVADDADALRRLHRLHQDLDDPIARAPQGILSLQLEGSGQIWYRNVDLKAQDKP
jgi:hypothetical protein